jgi:23S rRNA pseudouridine2605 synthase
MNPDQNPSQPPESDPEVPPGVSGSAATDTVAGGKPAQARSDAGLKESLQFGDVISGAYDAEQEGDLPLPTKRVLKPEAE